uniref:Uncharacterized protein n=2 Tax=Anguilla anguilla TaxID=7936 RepID=A0A0E9Q321_ANGAN
MPCSQSWCREKVGLLQCCRVT